LLSPSTSVYRLCDNLGAGEFIRLRRQYRLPPAITELMNDLADYGQPLDAEDAGQRAGSWPAMRAIPVEGYRFDDAQGEPVNLEEVAAIIDEIAALTTQRRSDQAAVTVAVISLLGASQAHWIKERAERVLDHKTLRELDFLALPASAMQGIERHVVFLSLVTTAASPALTTASARRRINTAISRASLQTRVVYSFAPEQAAQECIRRWLVESAQKIEHDGAGGQLKRDGHPRAPTTAPTQLQPQRGGEEEPLQLTPISVGAALEASQTTPPATPPEANKGTNESQGGTRAAPKSSASSADPQQRDDTVVEPITTAIVVSDPRTRADCGESRSTQTGEIGSTDANDDWRACDHSGGHDIEVAPQEQDSLEPPDRVHLRCHSATHSPRAPLSSQQSKAFTLRSLGGTDDPDRNLLCHRRPQPAQNLDVGLDCSVDDLVALLAQHDPFGRLPLSVWRVRVAAWVGLMTWSSPEAAALLDRAERAHAEWQAARQH